MFGKETQKLDFEQNVVTRFCLYNVCSSFWKTA